MYKIKRKTGSEVRRIRCARKKQEPRIKDEGNESERRRIGEFVVDWQAGWLASWLAGWLGMGWSMLGGVVCQLLMVAILTQASTKSYSPTSTN